MRISIWVKTFQKESRHGKKGEDSRSTNRQCCRQTLEAQDTDVTVSNTSNGGTVSRLPYQIQAIFMFTVSNTSEFFLNLKLLLYQIQATRGSVGG